MKLFIYGQHDSEIKTLAEKAGFTIVTENPQIIASVGGDGTFMRSEAEFPGIPKFILQKSKTSKKGHDISPEEILQKIIKGEYEVKEEVKIEVTHKDKKIVGLNEIIVHNTDPRRAVRYNVCVNDKKVGNEIIGDGIVVSTPFGSTGYYRSITDSFFEIGIGLAFNNSTEQSDHMVLKDDAKITLTVVRGKAVAYADNSDEEIHLDNDDTVTIQKSEMKAKIIHIK